MNRNQRELDPRQSGQPSAASEQSPGLCPELPDPHQTHERELRRAAEYAALSPVNASFISDLDDSLYDVLTPLMDLINEIIIAQRPDFAPITMEDLLAAEEARFDNIDRLRAYGEQTQTDVIHLANTNPELYRRASLFPEAMDLVNALKRNGVHLIAALTARPFSVFQTTRAILKEHGFASPVDSELPIISPPQVSTYNSTEAKLASLRALRPHLPPGHKVFYLEDIVKVAVAIHEQIGDWVTVMVPIVPRNRHLSGELQKLGIAHGTHLELAAHVQALLENR